MGDVLKEGELKSIVIRFSCSSSEVLIVQTLADKKVDALKQFIVLPKERYHQVYIRNERGPKNFYKRKKGRREENLRPEKEI